MTTSTSSDQPDEHASTASASRVAPPLDIREATAGPPRLVSDIAELRDAVVAEASDGHGPVWRGPHLVSIDETTTLPYLLRRRVERSATRPLIEVKQEMSHDWRPVTAADFLDQVLDTACGLAGLGLEFGDAVAIMSHTRYEWTLLDFACWFAGLVPVPIYETSSKEQIHHILADAGVRTVVAESLAMAELVRAAAAETDHPDLRVLSLDSAALQTIVAAGSGFTRAQLAHRTDRLTTDSVATIVYTSGTTGRPKGTVLTHGNFTDVISNAHRWMPEMAGGSDSRFLLFLPLAHVFARFIEVHQLTGEGVLGHTSDTKHLVSDLATFRPTYLLVVPRVLEKIYNTADAQAGTGLRRRIFRWAARTAIEYSRATEGGHSAPPALQVRHALAEKLVYRQILALVGGHLHHVISGGAPLTERLARFYTGAGLPILEGYGLTETVGPICVNTPHLNKIGTVGSLLPLATATISDHGELLIKGPSIFHEYRNDPEATAAAFTEDGWFRTGDLGSIDEDGYLHITGRLKEVIVTAGGKNVIPAVLEDALSSHPLISQIVVLGDKRPFVAALITLDADMLPMWLRNHGLPPMSVGDAATNAQVRASLDRAIEQANQQVSRAESIRKFTVLDTDFTEANGLLTPSLKVRRALVLQRYSDAIDQLYGGPLPQV